MSTLAETRVVGLRELLVQPSSAAPTAVAVQAVADPVVELEALRTRVMEQAKDAGFAQGMKDADVRIAATVDKATSEVQARHADLLKRAQLYADGLKALEAGLHAAVERLDQSVEALAVQIAMSAVLRVVGQRAGDESLTAAVCGEALREYRQRPVTIHVGGNVDDLTAELGLDGRIAFVADAELPLGACRLETHRGQYDTSVRSRLHAAVDALLDELERGK